MAHRSHFLESIAPGQLAGGISFFIRHKRTRPLVAVTSSVVWILTREVPSVHNLMWLFYACHAFVYVFVCTVLSNILYRHWQTLVIYIYAPYFRMRHVWMPPAVLINIMHVYPDRFEYIHVRVPCIQNADKMKYENLDLFCHTQNMALRCAAHRLELFHTAAAAPNITI